MDEAIPEVATLRQALLSLNGDDHKWQIVESAEEGIHLVAMWKLADTRWTDYFAKCGREATFCVLIKFKSDSKEVLLQDTYFSSSDSIGVGGAHFSVEFQRGKVWSKEYEVSYSFSSIFDCLKTLLTTGKWVPPEPTYEINLKTSDIKKPIHKTIQDHNWTPKSIIFRSAKKA